MKLTKTDFIAHAQQGDAAVIGELYERYHASIFRYLYYRVGDRQTAEDLTSEVFLRLIHSLPGFHPQKVSFQAWLFQIARNIVIDDYRKQSVRNHVELEEHLIAGTDDPSNTIEANLTSESLRQALNKLSDEQRDVIVMRFVAGMPINEVAQALNKSEDSIKGLQRRALITLRDILTEWEITYVEQ